MVKTVAILGSTGSIGKNALNVIARLKDKFKVVALASGGNALTLAAQVNKFRPKLAALMDETKFGRLKKEAAAPSKLLAGLQGIEEVAACGADIVVMAINGSAALLPTLKSLKYSKRLALANKECLVMAGEIIIRRARNHNAEIIPIDSEHSAIFQCLKGEPAKTVEKIYLTGSGGPLKDLSSKDIELIEPEFALKHPKWRMGKKITIDSATLMNKGLEIIEAHYLFNIAPEKIKVIIHPEAVIHSLVQFADGSILAQLGKADMRLPIQYALTYPRRVAGKIAALDFSRIEKLSFHPPNLVKFPCLQLALQAAKQKGLAGAALAAADEECVFAYLARKIRITDIARIIERVLSRLRNKSHPSLAEILAADQWAREEAKRSWKF